MRVYYDRASRKTGVTGEELIRQLETRLDAIVVLRMGSRSPSARPASSSPIATCGQRRRLDVPSAQVKPETRSSCPTRRGKLRLRSRGARALADAPVPLCDKTSSGHLSRLPERGEIPLPVKIEERLIIEYYSYLAPLAARRTERRP